jgi:hypothetical protein
MKITGSALLKDATPDDLALMSQQSAGLPSNDANSEFARLQRLPGYFLACLLFLCLFLNLTFILQVFAITEAIVL